MKSAEHLYTGKSTGEINHYTILGKPKMRLMKMSFRSCVKGSLTRSMTIDVAWGTLTWSMAKEIGIEVAGGMLTWIPQVNGDGICPRQINLGYQVNLHEWWEMDGEREEQCKTELCVILFGSICTQQPTTTTRSHSRSFPPTTALPQAWPSILDQASYASNQPKHHLSFCLVS